MFPIRDHNPSNVIPWVTWSLIAVNVAIFLATSPALNDPEFLARYAVVPAINAPSTYLTSQFLHGGLLHLAGNMLFLWIFGDNLEEKLGRLPFLGFYLLSGVAAALAQTATAPASTVPMIGASGAIAGVMGAYLLLFPRAKVDVLLIFIVFFKILPIPAWLVLGVWFAIQVISGTNMPNDAGGVAYWAHAGGFVAGLAMAVPVWIRSGGPAYWRVTHGHPPHPEARYVLRRTPIPRAGQRK